MSWWAPGAVTLALALGSPVDPAAPPDCRISLESEWNAVAAQGSFERRDGATLWGYDLSAAKGVGQGWRASGEDRRLTGRGINRQTAIALHGIYRQFAAGGGLTTRKYKRPHGAIAFRLPLPGGGLEYFTDFKRVHVTDAEASLEWKASERIAPFIAGRFYRDGRSDWRIEVGAKFSLAVPAGLKTRHGFNH